MQTVNMTMLSVLALTYLGVPYQWGGDHPLIGLDCSGMVQMPLKKLGILLQARDYASGNIYEALVEKGFKESPPCEDCILFFGTGRISHVAIALNSEWMIEARGGGRTTMTKEDAIERMALTEITRIDHRKDLLHSIKLEY